MFDYFWVAEELLPPGLGFGLFSPAHLIWLGLLALLAAGMCLGYKRLGAKKRRRMLRLLAFGFPVAELGRDLILAAQGVFTPVYWPLHLCSAAMFLLLAYVVRPNRFCGETLYSLCLPGTLSALLFPNWAGIDPVLQFQSIYSFLYHGVLVGCILMLLVSGEFCPRPGGIHYPLLFLLAAVPPLYFINKALNTNFFFLNGPSPGSPLEPLARIFGNPGYLAPFAVLAAAIVSLFYAPLWLGALRSRHVAAL